jgi:2-methylisocitrate lyase-like PEP mutase family enzyme
MRIRSARPEQGAAAFRALHEGAPFVVLNPWDVGSARVLEALGFRALATTSSGFAFTLGRLDGNVSLDEVVSHVTSLTSVTDLPVSVDLENGYGADPMDAAHAVARVAEDAGAIGGSIEDWDPNGYLYDKGHAAERIAAAAPGDARAPVRLHADRARGELHPRPSGSRRHDRSPPGV